jgi:allophanate hydrolase
MVQIPDPCQSSAAATPAHAPSWASEAWLFRPSTPLEGANRGKLLGLRFAVKDNIDVAGWPTSAACQAFTYQANAHATVVQKLLDAGASLSGKTNLDQFACGLNGTRSPFGAVPNAINPLYVSGGSSAGSAYAVATGQVDFSLGTDTAGSGRVPAGLNNIVGLKPSRGLVSARGVVPAAQAVDCVSIFATTVGLAAEVLAAALGHDAADPYSRAIALLAAPFGARFRFGVPAKPEFFGDEAARSAFDDALVRMTALGGEAVPLDFSVLSACNDMLYGSALVSQRYAAIRTFFDAHAAEVIEPVRSIVAAGRDHSAADLVDAQTRLAALSQQAAQLWEGIDLLVVPTAPTHHTIERMRADPVALNRQLGEYTNFVNLLDYAALSVPSSIRADGLPFGITLIGQCGSDWQLAELGQRYHHATGLSQGATGVPLPQPLPIAGLSQPAHARVSVAVVGAHLSGMPLNGQLTERGARLIASSHTAPLYRLYALPGTTPPKPGLLKVASGEGESIEVEIWDMPLSHYGSFVALVPSPLCIGTLELADGARVQGFLCEPLALQGATDITHLRGWRAYIHALSSSPPAGS